MERVRKALNIYTSQKGGEGNLCEKKKKNYVESTYTEWIKGRYVQTKKNYIRDY